MTELPPLTPEQRERFDGCLRLAYRLANQYHARHARVQVYFERDDLASIATTALLIAVRHFDPGRGVCFSTYAQHCIGHAFRRSTDGMGIIRVPLRLVYQVANPEVTGDRIEAARKAQVVFRLGMLTTPEPPDPSDECARQAEEDVDRQTYSRVRVGQILRRLEAADRWLLTLIYLRGMTLGEVGRLLGITKQAVSQRRRGALARARGRRKRREATRAAD